MGRRQASRPRLTGRRSVEVEQFRAVLADVTGQTMPHVFHGIKELLIDLETRLGISAAVLAHSLVDLVRRPAAGKQFKRSPEGVCRTPAADCLERLGRECEI